MLFESIEKQTINSIKENTAHRLNRLFVYQINAIINNNVSIDTVPNRQLNADKHRRRVTAFQSICFISSSSVSLYDFDEIA